MMALLKHVTSGAVVRVPDEKVERLGSEWVPFEVESQKAPKSRSKK